MTKTKALSLFILMNTFMVGISGQAIADIDLSGYNTKSPIKVTHEGTSLSAEWHSDTEIRYLIKFDVSGSNTLISSISIAKDANTPFKVLAENIHPDFQVTIGSRSKTDWPYVFFDHVHKRPFETFSSEIDLKSVKVKSDKDRLKLTFSTISSGSFYGDLECHIYTGSPLIYWEATMTTEQYAVAYIYDGLFRMDVPNIVYQDNVTKKIIRETPKKNLTTYKVRYRTMMVENEGGTIAFFPPPHASFWPFDRTILNRGFLQAGKGVIGTRQDTEGDTSFSPWVDAPAGKYQRMGVFQLLSPTKAEATLERVKLYTHGDQFKIIDNYKTYTGHYHPKLTQYELDGKPQYVKEFKNVMKNMNIQIVHLAEFHCCGDWEGHDVGIERLNQLKGMFDLTKKYSDDEITFLPGEEANAHWGGHWNYLFPKPVYFVKSRKPNEPFVQTIEPYGEVYKLGSSQEVYEMLKRENGIAYTAHPRVKGSKKFPDTYAHEGFFKDDDVFLGGEWKAVPSDLSEPRLGKRVFQLQDEMNQWGFKKKIVGAVDVFYLDSTSSIYSQMNINYLKLPKLPSTERWPEVIDVLKRGDFFVSTGEVLLHSHAIKVNKVMADIEWTFPLGFAEITWGEGEQIKSHVISLSETQEFGRKEFEFSLDLSKASWARLEVWDIARNGAFTQTTWFKKPINRTLGIGSFTLINADTNYPVPGYEPIQEGDIIDLNQLPTKNLNIRIDPSPYVATKIDVEYDEDATYNSDSNYPFSVAGEKDGHYDAWTPTLGKHKIKATPYKENDKGRPLSLNFTIIDSRNSNYK